MNGFGAGGSSNMTLLSPVYISIAAMALAALMVRMDDSAPAATSIDDAVVRSRRQAFTSPVYSVWILFIGIYMLVSVHMLVCISYALYV